MALTDRVRITLPSTDYGGAIGTKTPVFEGFPSKEGEMNLEGSVEPNFILTSQFEQVNGILQDVLGDGVPQREGVYFDVGGGTTGFTATFETPTTNSGYQWGSDATTAGPNEHTATGADREAQIAVLVHALRLASTDSRTPATFEWGEWSSSGFLSGLDVVVTNATWSFTNTDTHTATVTLALATARDIAQALDGTEQVE